MVCPRCSTENPDGVRFCGACGTPVLRGPEPSDPVYMPPGALPKRQFGIAILSATLFLYCADSTLGFVFVLLRTSEALSNAGVQLAGYLVLACRGGWGVVS